MPSPKDLVPLEDSALVHIPGARLAGLVNPNEVAEVTVFVRSSSSSSNLDSAIEEMASRPVGQRQHLSRQEFTAKYGADPGDMEKIETFANDHGLSVSAIDLGKRSARLIGPIGNFAKAFNVPLSNYSSPRGPYRAYTGHVHVPHELSDVVKGVFGLDTIPVVTNHLRTRSAAQAGTVVYTPGDVAALYNFPAGLFGQGQTVAILEFSGPQRNSLCGYQTSDLQAYFQSLGVAMPNIRSVSVAGAYNAPTGNPNSGDGEVCLDIEVLGAIVPQAEIVVYFAPNSNDGFLRAIQTATFDSFHLPGVISISWGGRKVPGAHLL